MLDLPFPLTSTAGLTVMGIADGKIAWGRLYIEPVEQNGEGREASVKCITR